MTTTARAEAESLLITSEAELAAMQSLLDELLIREELAEPYLNLLAAEEVSENSKWVIQGSGQLNPLLDLTGESE